MKVGRRSEGGRKVVEGGREVVEGGRKVVLVPQNCFYWGAAALQTPLFLGGFQTPRPPGGGPAAPRAPLHTERLRLSGSP